MRSAALLWLVGWAMIGLPWRSFAYPPSFENVRLIPFRDGRPVSHALNVLAFMPAGALGVGFGWRVAQATLAGAAISTITEGLQTFSRRRYPSSTDVLLNTAGAFAGAALAHSARRRRVDGVTA